MSKLFPELYADGLNNFAMSVSKEAPTSVGAILPPTQSKPPIDLSGLMTGLRNAATTPLAQKTAQVLWGQPNAVVPGIGPVPTQPMQPAFIPGGETAKKLIDTGVAKVNKSVNSVGLQKAAQIFGGAAKMGVDFLTNPSPEPGVQMAIMPLAGKMKGLNVAAHLAETGVPFKAKLWRAGKVKGGSTFTFDTFTTPQSTKFGNIAADEHAQFLFGSGISKINAHVKNPAVFMDKFEAIEKLGFGSAEYLQDMIDMAEVAFIEGKKIPSEANTLFQKFGINFQQILRNENASSPPLNMVMDELIAKKARALGHDAVVLQNGDTLPINMAKGQYQPEIMLLKKPKKGAQL